MNMRMTLFGVWLMLVSVVLAGCAEPVETPLSPTETVVPNLVPSATPTIESTVTSTQVITTKTPTPEPGPAALTVREPTLEQLASYFDYSNLQYCPAMYLEDCVSIFYEDVNGDSERDLIVLYASELHVLIWQVDHYGSPFFMYGDWLRGGPNASVSFEDWTGDGVSEVVFDNQILDGGTGLGIYDTERYIIYCQNLGCKVVWHARLASTTDDQNFGGMANYQSEIHLSKNEDGQVVLHYLFGGFAIYATSLDGQFPFNENGEGRLLVLPSTLSLFTWTGENFEPLSEEVVSPGYIVESRAVLNATSSSGAVANIVAEPNDFNSNENDVCQLLVDRVSVGSPFGCKSNFTTVEWKDITGDGQEEIVIIALSGSYPKDKEHNLLGDADCVHQRLLAYQWNGILATEISNIAGCVVREDLYGIRLEDVDQDGQSEILAAADDEHTLDQIYKWNGSRFVFWDDVPAQ